MNYSKQLILNNYLNLMIKGSVWNPNILCLYLTLRPWPCILFPFFYVLNYLLHCCNRSVESGKVRLHKSPYLSNIFFVLLMITDWRLVGWSLILLAFGDEHFLHSYLGAYNKKKKDCHWVFLQVWVRAKFPHFILCDCCVKKHLWTLSPR